MNLTSIPLIRIIDEKLKEYKYSNILLDDFKFFANPFNMPEQLFWLSDVFKKQIKIESFNNQIRVDEIFLKEIDELLELNALEFIPNYKQIIITYLFVKHLIMIYFIQIQIQF